MQGAEIMQRRKQSGLAGFLVCRKSGICRSRLSAIERGYVQPTADEVRRIESAITGLTLAREHIAKTAAEVGWPNALV